MAKLELEFISLIPAPTEEDTSPYHFILVMVEDQIKKIIGSAKVVDSLLASLLCLPVPIYSRGRLVFNFITEAALWQRINSFIKDTAFTEIPLDSLAAQGVKVGILEIVSDPSSVPAVDPPGD